MVVVYSGGGKGGSREQKKRGEFKGPKEVYIGFTFRVSILERDFFGRRQERERMGHGVSLFDRRRESSTAETGFDDQRGWTT